MSKRKIEIEDLTEQQKEISKKFDELTESVSAVTASMTDEDMKKNLQDKCDEKIRYEYTKARKEKHCHQDCPPEEKYVSNNEGQLTFEDMGVTVKCKTGENGITIQKVKLEEEPVDNYIKLSDEMIAEKKKDINKLIRALKDEDEYENSARINSLEIRKKLLHSIEIENALERLENKEKTENVNESEPKEETSELENYEDYTFKYDKERLANLCDWVKNATFIDENGNKHDISAEESDSEMSDNLKEQTQAEKIERPKHDDENKLYDNEELQFKEEIDKILIEIEETLIKKNHDYKSSFQRQWLNRKYRGKNPLEMVDVRLTDKYDRLIGIIDGNPQYVDESIQDTLKDLIGYSVLTLRMLNKE